jgi:hypothetical protein
MLKSHMKLNEAFQTVALKLQEEATDLSHADIRTRLADTLNDAMEDGQYGYICDIFGDDESGDVVYSCGGDLKKCPYEFSQVNGKQVAEIDFDRAVDVVPRTVYEEEADDEDSMTSMESARKRDKLYTALPTYERFIAKSERDAADSGSFAGKGKSFPILKPGDVMAAVRSMGRAGSGNVGTSTLKKNIIAIAKKKGWTKYLPKAWQGGSEDTTESVAGSKATEGVLVLVEAASTLETIVLKEAKADYEIKLIAPGAGSSAFYPKEVLQRDGPKVFKKETHVYLNHPTAAEEAARPENDVRNLAGVLTTDAVYYEAHAKGPGLYARMKVFADHGQLVEEKAPHVGMSIRASGKAESNQKKNGLPVLTELTSAESVDVVTRAGAGGMILTEAARTAESPKGVEDMTAEDVQKLVEAGVRKATLPATAREKAHALLEAVTLPDLAKKRIVERAVATLNLSEALDEKKLGEAVAAEAKAEGEYLASITGSGRVVGMASVTPIDPKEAKRAKKDLKESKREARDIFESLGMTEAQAKMAVRGREDAA